MPTFAVVGPERARDLSTLWAHAVARARNEPARPKATDDRVEALVERLSVPGAFAIIAEMEFIPVACGFATPLTDADGRIIAGFAHVSGIAVDPDLWGRGLATAVLAHCENTALTTLQLHVLESNTRARRLYERLGWRLLRTGDPHPDGPQAVYEKCLKQP